MANQIKTMHLEEAQPPYFELDVGHSAKVLSDGSPVWVKVIDIRGDDFIGIVHSAEPGLRRDVPRKQDVIAFGRKHIFGMA